MTGKIFRAIMLAAGGVLLACTLVIMGCLYDYFAGVQESQLWQELSFAAVGVEGAGEEYLEALSTSSSRLTWIAADGSVLYDAQADEKTMENHAAREEVREALARGEGSSERYSSTLMEKTIYCARRLSDGTVLRISVSTASLGMLAFGMMQPICAVVLAALVLAAWLAKRLAGRIVAPLNTLDLECPLENQAYDEIAPLLRRISQQSSQIQSQLCSLRQKQDEFTQITASMKEGLVLLDNRGVILSINPAAQALFETDDRCVGQDFLTVERRYEIDAALSAAMQAGHSEISLERGGRTYQLDLSRIDSGGVCIGAVMLAFDVTQKADAERSRREFSANVSHELKTPLAAILGSSEMIENGMVKPEDLPRFAGHIHKEAARLLSLIEDIIRLSQLDEGAQLPKEAVNLASVAEEAAAQLEEKAAARQVHIAPELEPCPMQSVSRLVHEIVYNLLENAIKYNVEGGSVTLRVTKEGKLTVTDTGIGIAPEHRERIFERFYRVDQSHSRQTGGTGLGLSIVKHAARHLGAEISLESELGKGTSIHVQFPL